MVFQKRLLIIFVFSIFFCIHAQAQSKFGPAHVGVYHSGFINQVGVGTDNEKLYFGELRLLASDLIDFPFGVEGMFHRNFKRGEWVNLHAGIMIGYFEDDSGRVGVPLGLTFKPIAAHRNFAVLMEATPNIYPSSGSFAIRSNIGLRYSFRKE